MTDCILAHSLAASWKEPPHHQHRRQSAPPKTHSCHPAASSSTPSRRPAPPCWWPRSPRHLPGSPHPACRPGPYLPPANLRVGQPPVRGRHPRGCRPSRRPSSVTPPSFPYPPPDIGHPAVVGVPPARRQAPRRRWLPPRPPSATPRSWACPPSAVGHPVGIGLLLARSRPPRGCWRAPRPSLATPRSSAAPLPALGRPTVFVAPPPAFSHPTAVGLPLGGRRPPRGIWRALHPPLATPLVLVCPLPSVGRPAVVGLPLAYDQLTYAFRRRRCASVLVEILPYVSRGAPPSSRMMGATLRLLLLWGPSSAAGCSAFGPQRRPRSQIAHRPSLKVLDQYSVSCLGSRAEQGTCSHRVIFWVVFGGGSKGKGQRAIALVDIIPIHRLVECGTGVRSFIAGTMPINT